MNEHLNLIARLAVGIVIFVVIIVIRCLSGLISSRVKRNKDDQRNRK